MNVVNNNHDILTIDSFYPAVFLFAKGHTLLNIDKTDSKRMRFVFGNCDELKRLLEVFNFAASDDPESLIDARKFVGAIKSLKEKMYQI